jgi:hypothetical protein
MYSSYINHRHGSCQLLPLKEKLPKLVQLATPGMRVDYDYFPYGPEAGSSEHSGGTSDY